MQDLKYLIGLLAVIAILATGAVTFSAKETADSIADNGPAESEDVDG